ncbi:MAG: hypothetical protein M1294_15615 [Firmicutes bacterium]|nr:hypothetical protein [Bacillota bacterium]
MVLDEWVRIPRTEADPSEKEGPDPQEMMIVSRSRDFFMIWQYQTDVITVSLTVAGDDVRQAYDKDPSQISILLLHENDNQARKEVTRVWKIHTSRAFQATFIPSYSGFPTYQFTHRPKSSYPL